MSKEDTIGESFVHTACFAYNNRTQHQQKLQRIKILTYFVIFLPYRAALYLFFTHKIYKSMDDTRYRQNLLIIGAVQVPAVFVW